MTERPDPARIVADADVLAADLLVGGPAREAMDHVRSHSWVELVASDHLLEDARGVVAELADEGLANDWLDRVEEECVIVEHPADDHPGLASAYHGSAAHLLSFDDGLTGAGAGISLQAHVDVSVRHPVAFVRVFDPESLYRAVEGGSYPGPDCDPRS